MVLFAERWYGYRLTREAGDPAAAATPSAGIGTGTLRVRRGLLTRRSLSVSEQRLRGVEVVEPLLLRAGRGAYSKALSTGLTRSAQGGALQPPCPRPEAHRVASAALREQPHEITLAPLRKHPRAALQRRMTRALVPTAVLVAGRVRRRVGRALPGRAGGAEPGAAPARRPRRPRPLPEPGPRAHRPLPGEQAGLRPAADRRPAAGRRDRLDVPAEHLPAPIRSRHGGGDHGGGRGRLPGARRRRCRRRRTRRRLGSAPAHALPRDTRPEEPQLGPR